MWLFSCHKLHNAHTEKSLFNVTDWAHYYKCIIPHYSLRGNPLTSFIQWFSNALIACPQTETSLATQHLIRNHTFPSANIGICGVLIKCCSKTTGIPSDSFFSCSLSENLGGKKKSPNFPVFKSLVITHPCKLVSGGRAAGQLHVWRVFDSEIPGPWSKPQADLLWWNRGRGMPRISEEDVRLCWVMLVRLWMGDDEGNPDSFSSCFGKESVDAAFQERARSL